MGSWIACSRSNLDQFSLSGGSARVLRRCRLPGLGKLEKRGLWFSWALLPCIAGEKYADWIRSTVMLIQTNPHLSLFRIAHIHPRPSSRFVPIPAVPHDATPRGFFFPVPAPLLPFAFFTSQLQNFQVPPIGFISCLGVEQA